TSGGARFAVGVDGNAFPQARVFQKSSPTTVRPKKKSKGGRYAMAWFLGLTYGVWFSNARLERGLVIHPRRVSLGPDVKKRAQEILRQWIVKGRAQLGR